MWQYLTWPWPLTKCEWQSHIADLKKELELARKKGPPPRQWDGEKPKHLPWPIAIYYKGERYDNVAAYDLNNGWFEWLAMNSDRRGNKDIVPFVGTHHISTKPDGFIVERLH